MITPVPHTNTLELVPRMCIPVLTKSIPVLSKYNPVRRNYVTNSLTSGTRNEVAFVVSVFYTSGPLQRLYEPLRY